MNRNNLESSSSRNKKSNKVIVGYLSKKGQGTTNKKQKQEEIGIPIEMGLTPEDYKELGPIGVWTPICHRK